MKRFETDNALFIFGSAQLKKDMLSKSFPGLEFCFLKQVHGNRVVNCQPEALPEADGHFTKKPGQALIIQTADCIPLMLANKAEVCALHAGWRGVASKIAGITKGFFTKPPDVAVIGPHIHCESFEIGTDVAEKLLCSVIAADSSELVRSHPDPAKCYFDLSALLKLQVQTLYPRIQFHDVSENTFTSKDYHSFRRDKDGAGRQYSFVVLKP